MCKKCTGTNYDKEHCDVEKYGCEGCGHYKKECENDEQKISECTSCKGD
jgi:hypothetical protein